MSHANIPQALLVLPRLRVQNANAISSPLTHGFPSVTAFTGLMWALERKLAQADVPLHLHAVGVVCHHSQEQVKGAGRLYDPHTFNLRRPYVATAEQARKLEEGTPPSIVEEGRIHLEITLVFTVSEKTAPGTAPTLVQDAETAMQQWADKAGSVLSQMRVAGGSLLPSRAGPGKRVRPWLRVLSDDAQRRAEQFREWRRQWLPGFALVGRDDLLAERLRTLQATDPQTTLLDAWLHAARFNHQPIKPEGGKAQPADGKVLWEDPLRKRGSGWLVPIPVGYAALSARHAAGSVLNARDAAAPLRFVESIYSMGEWISPHRLTHLEQLLWHAETDETKGLYRCRNGYQPAPESADAAVGAEEWDDDEDTYAYT